MTTWRDYFPLDSKPREGQARAIETILEAFESGKKNFVLEGPTGQGKSAIAVTVARYMLAKHVPSDDDESYENGAYVLTTQKLLQQQYLRDFERHGMLELKSATNYSCGYDSRQSCGESKRALKALGKAVDGTAWKRHCTNQCVYNLAKREFLQGHLGVTNYSYFMAESTYSGKITPRELLVLDECLRGDAKIMTSLGKEVTIKEIYENDAITHVMSFNQELNTYEQKRILRRIRTPYTRDTEWYEIKIASNDKHSDMSCSTLTVTGNHKIWTQNRGYVRADQLTTDDIVKFDTSNKENITFSISRPRVIKPLLQIRKSIKHTCIWCEKTFETFKYEKHVRDRILRNCSTCLVTFEVPRSNLKQVYCSHKCYSVSDEIAEKRSTRMKLNNPMKIREVALKAGARCWASKSEEQKAAQLERFMNAPRHERRNSPNRLERFVIEMQLPNVKFVGLGEKWLRFLNGKRKNPDFIIEGQKKVIEVGDVEFWHTLEEIEDVKAKYLEIGYDCLYLTNRQIDTEPEWCRAQISKFVNNHDTKITSIRKLQPPRRFDKNVNHFKYNIEVEDNHNYFANSILVSNCHNIEAELTKFVEIEITDRFCKKFLGINLSSYDDPEKLYEWITKKYKPALSIIVEKTKNSLSMINEGAVSNDEMFKSLVKQNDQLDKHICKVNRFIEQFDVDSWVVNRERRKDHRGERNSLQFKPIDGTKWTEPYLLRFGKRRLMMSATVLNSEAFCKSIGLDMSTTASMSLPSTFPVENRRVHYVGVGSMSMREIDQTLPKMANAVKELLEVHSDVKGIIHTANFRVANYIRDHVRDKRLLCHSSDDRDQVLKQHQTSKKPTVLLSPSMIEGVDLADDMSRFQIIVKLPYPSLADKSLSKRIKRDPWYYDYLTARSFVQSLGRSVRHENDHCVTYVLDGLFPMFMRKCADTIPQYIKDAINM